MVPIQELINSPCVLGPHTAMALSPITPSNLPACLQQLESAMSWCQVAHGILLRVS